MTTHSMEGADLLADCIGVMAKGKVGNSQTSSITVSLYSTYAAHFWEFAIADPGCGVLVRTQETIWQGLPASYSKGPAVCGGQGMYVWVVIYWAFFLYLPSQTLNNQKIPKKMLRSWRRGTPIYDVNILTCFICCCICCLSPCTKLAFFFISPKLLVNPEQPLDFVQRNRNKKRSL